MTDIIPGRKRYDLESVLLSKSSLHNLANRLHVRLHSSATSLSLANSFFCVLGAITVQGMAMRPNACSVRTATFVCLLFGSLMYTSYSAVLVSRLAIIKTDAPVNNLNDILESKRYSVCVREDSYAIDLFKRNNQFRPEWKGVVNGYPCLVIGDSINGIVSSLCKDNTIILETDNIMSAILERFDKCSITKLKTKYSFAFISVLVRKGFPYRKVISMHLLKLQATGLIDLLKGRWLSKKNQKLDPSMYPGDVTIDHVESILHLYFYVVCSSLLLLACELIVFNKKFKKITLLLKYIVAWKSLPN